MTLEIMNNLRIILLYLSITSYNVSHTSFNVTPINQRPQLVRQNATHFI